jgi:DNA replication protein DnaC
MERSEILATMGELKLYGMKAAFDEIITTAVKRQHEPQRVVGDLLSAEISEKQARSIKYQITIAKLPLAKDIGDFTFGGTPINETLVRDLIGGNFLAHQRNVVLVGGTGTGKWHLAIAIARACIRDGETRPVLSMSSIWSTGLRPRAAPDARDGWPTISIARTSSSSTNSAICHSPRPADSCCST